MGEIYIMWNSDGDMHNKKILKGRSTKTLRIDCIWFRGKRTRIERDRGKGKKAFKMRPKMETHGTNAAEIGLVGCSVLVGSLDLEFDSLAV
jgi:hypothetical protein